MTPLDILLTMRATLSSPDAWTKGAYARADDYTAVLPDDPRAACFCTLGALERANPGTPWEAARLVLKALRRHHPSEYPSVADWNDHPSTTHADVLHVLDRAIADVRGGSHALRRRRRGDSGYASASWKDSTGGLRGRR